MVSYCQMKEAIATLLAQNWRCEERRIPHFEGGSTNGLQDGMWNRNATTTIDAAGLATVVFDMPHPDGVEYHIDIEASEPIGTRDNPKETVVEGSKTANGFQLMLTVDDNGGTADPFSTQPFSWSVSKPERLVVCDPE